MIRKQTETPQNQPGTTPTSEDPSDSNRFSSTNPLENTSSSTELVLKKLEFLVSPGMGYILQFLQGSHRDNFVVKRHALQLLCKILEFKGNPFVRKKSVVDAYVGFFYIKFIKLYQNHVLDKPTLELCQLYLRVLLSFSMCKSVGHGHTVDRIAMKFHQLKTMDFLVREISLEYEVKLNRESKVCSFNSLRTLAHFIQG